MVWLDRLSHVILGLFEAHTNSTLRLALLTLLLEEVASQRVSNTRPLKPSTCKLHTTHTNTNTAARLRLIIMLALEERER